MKGFGRHCEYVMCRTEFNR